LLLPKFQSILEQGYVVSNQSAIKIAELEEFIISYIDYFGVPKADDIHVVYNNGASCGLNETVWAPNVLPPTPKICYSGFKLQLLWSEFGPGGNVLELPPPHAFSTTIGD
jgi:hypothetical protein